MQVSAIAILLLQSRKSRLFAAVLSTLPSRWRARVPNLCSHLFVCFLNRVFFWNYHLTTSQRINCRLCFTVQRPRQQNLQCGCSSAVLTGWNMAVHASSYEHKVAFDFLPAVACRHRLWRLHLHHRLEIKWCLWPFTVRWKWTAVTAGLSRLRRLCTLHGFVSVLCS